MSAPVGLAALTLRVPLVLSEADSHLGLSNRLLAPLRPPRVPRLPDPRAARRPATASPADRSRPPRDADREARPAALRHPARRPAACWCSAARSAPARSTWRRPRRSPRRPSTCSTSAAAATTRSWPGARCRPRYHLLRVPRPRALRQRRSTPPIWRSPAPAGRCSSSPPTGCRRSSCPYPHAAADHQSANARWMERAGAAVTVADAELTRRRLVARRSESCSADRGGWPRWPAPRARWRAPTPPAAVAGELLAAAAMSAARRARAQPWAGRRMHLVGVGGAGMSAYARAAHALGAEVSGSDAREGALPAGAARPTGCSTRSVGHAAANLPGGDGVELVLLHAPSPAENPERVAARERGHPGAPRAPAAGRAVGAAAHDRRRRNPRQDDDRGDDRPRAARRRAGAGLADRRARSAAACRTAHWSEGEWLVVEADESDRSLLELNVEIALLTNVELDHHATFGSLERAARGVPRVPGAGRPTAVVWDRPELLALRGGPLVAYDAPSSTLTPGGSRFRWRGLRGRARGARAPTTRSTPPGRSTLARLAGADAGAGGRGAGRLQRRRRGAFSGSARRAGGAPVYDDYAHHPTEVAATLQGARTLEHRAAGRGLPAAPVLAHAGARARVRRGAGGADVVVVLDVYPARERAEDFPGVSGLLVAEAAADAAAGRPVVLAADVRRRARRCSAGAAASGDVCVVMGAGDVDALGGARWWRAMSAVSRARAVRRELSARAD